MLHGKEGIGQMKSGARSHGPRLFIGNGCTLTKNKTEPIPVVMHGEGSTTVWVYFSVSEPGQPVIIEEIFKTENITVIPLFNLFLIHYEVFLQRTKKKELSVIVFQFKAVKKRAVLMRCKQKRGAPIWQIT